MNLLNRLEKSLGILYKKFNVNNYSLKFISLPIYHDKGEFSYK